MTGLPVDLMPVINTGCFYEGTEDNKEIFISEETLGYHFICH